MDSYLWRYRQQSEHQAPGLALLAPEPSSSSSSINKAAVAVQTPFFTLPSVGYFTLAQWQELELQALIYKYMLAGLSVPVELILPIRRSLLSASPYFHYPDLYHHFQPSLLQTSYWRKCGIDPEPGRCRRTDGKKWRCSRDVVVGQKYCERHVHRGRNRSRKHVEAPTPSSITLKTGLSSTSVLLAQEKHLNLPRPLATPNAHSLDQRQSDIKTVEKNLQGNCPSFYLDNLPDNKPEGYVLQRFLDEWPKSRREKNGSIDYAIHPASTTHLSISVPGNHSSDFSLKLSTGNPEKPRENNNNGLEMQQLSQSSNKGSGWVSHGSEATLGGPLAEALRSSNSTHSPTSVLHKPNGSIYEISSISP